MTALATNTFATVTFQKTARFDFESLVTEFQHALDDGLSASVQMRRVGGEFVSFDMGRAQLSLAYSRARIETESQRAHQASLAVYVTPAETTGANLAPTARAGLCKGVLDRIEAVHPCDHRVWGETDRAILPLYDAAPAATAQLGKTTISPKRVHKLAATGRRARPTMPLDAGTSPDPVPALAKAPAKPIRLTHPALYADRVRGNQPRPQPRQVALGLPQTAERDLTILRNVFAPDHDEISENGTDRPVAHRLAIYTLNTSLVVICLPVGAAMFSYCAMGRENLTAVGRAMALTGIGIALTNGSLLGAVLPLIG